MTAESVRAIAFYLPQYHPIPENDAWWGKGFTEWNNVVKARPLFPGHYQPHLPADLGFYDLRLPEARQAQADLAREYGIHGFCYYHYWFNGRRLLERPVNEIVASGQPDFPFCLCWANENWTRRWDGEDQDVLLKQDYSPEDDVAHFHALAKYFRDPRYIKVNGKPLFLFYRISNLPDPAATCVRWRSEAARLGFPGVYLCNVESIAKDREFAGCGFDAAVEFAPDWDCAPPRVLPGVRKPPFFRKQPAGPPWSNNLIFDYIGLRDRMLAKPKVPYLRFPGVTPSWDNSARKKENAIIFQNATPAAYEHWLTVVAAKFKPPSPEENFIFINSWNEWAEGNHLEPCSKLGRAYLEVTRRALMGRNQIS